MKGRDELVDRAERSARKTIRAWIRRALRESFLQGIRQAWTVRPDDNGNDNGSGPSTGDPLSSLREDASQNPAGGDAHRPDDSRYGVELHVSGVGACFRLVERVSEAWQRKLRDEHHGRAAEWVAEVHREGKPTLWAEPREGDGDSDNDNDNDNDNNGNDRYHGNENDDITNHETSGFVADKSLVHGREENGMGSETKDPDVNYDDDDDDDDDDDEEGNEKTTLDPSSVNTNHGSVHERADAPENPNETRFRPNVYSALRSLGRKHELNHSVLSVPEALDQIKEFTRRDPAHTYWPLDNEIIDRASVELSHRMRARDRHGYGHGYGYGSGNGHGNNSAKTGRDGGNVITMKTVRFKVVPKAVRETKKKQQQQQQHGQGPPPESSVPLDRDDNDNEKDNNEDNSNNNKRDNDAEPVAAPSTTERDKQTRAATLMLASSKRKNKASANLSRLSRKKARPQRPEDVPRPPCDAALPDDDGVIPIVLSEDEKKALDRLLVLDDNDGDNDDRSRDRAKSPVPLGLFGGLQFVGQTNHHVKNPEPNGNGNASASASANKRMLFLSKENTNKITRRKERDSIQERLDPNRVRAERRENPGDRNSKVLRTEDWFDDRKKFLELDLGWSLLEVPVPAPADADADANADFGEGNDSMSGTQQQEHRQEQHQHRQKRLCAFSSLEVCLGDHD